MDSTYNAPVHPVAGDFKPLFTSMVMQKDLAEQELIKARKEIARLNRMRELLSIDLGRTLKELHDRELHHFETEQMLEKVKEALADTPMVCDVHDDNDPITCGWKRAVEGVQKALQ